MIKITDEELRTILEKHIKWIISNKDGERADLRGADLRMANLREAYLTGANLTGANLTGADLREADLREADLTGADLKGANLKGADLLRANLLGADLRGANLTGANLTGADLTGANLTGADLKGANLRMADLRRAYLRGAYLRMADLLRANLTGADLKGANLKGAENIPYIPMYCPCEGSFIGWKKANLKTKEGLIKLEILEDSLRSSATSEKCRCDKAKVLKITSLDEKYEYDEAYSLYDKNFIYKVGEIVSVDNFCENRFDECAPGIHFFINKQTAIDHIL